MRSILLRGASGDGERLLVKRRFALQRDLPAVLEKLLSSGVLRHDGDFPNVAWRVADRPDLRPAEVCCVVDPYCYVSHISAMERWGLTNRNPIALQLTRPNPILWRVLAGKEVGDYEREETPSLEGSKGVLPPEFYYAAEPTHRRYFFFPSIVRGTTVHTYNTAYPGKSVAVPDTEVRLATVGQTFLDMLSEPKLCGGMTHVLEVWDESAAVYLEEIVETVNITSSQIVKVRAGYILDERLGLDHPAIEEWLKAAQRGGSQRLDPSRPYEPPFSEKWMLSLNA